MVKTLFLKLCKQALTEYGFEKQKNGYFRDYGNAMIMIDIARSNYSECYYFDYGYCIKEISRGLPYPKIWELDLRGRLDIPFDGVHTYEVYPDKISGDAFEARFRETLEKVIIPNNAKTDEFLKGIIHSQKCTATAWALEHLEIENNFNSEAQ